MSSFIYSANQLSLPYCVPGTRKGTDPTEMNRVERSQRNYSIGGEAALKMTPNS